MNKKVSVVIPCFNAEFTIRKTLESVLNQSYSNIEVIVVDDCSTDNTISVVKTISKLHSNVSIISTNKNSGSPAQPRNLGIISAVGDYICFLDADDSWYFDKISIQLEFMEKHNLSFTYTPYDISVNGVVTHSYYPNTSVNFEQLLRLNIVGCLTTMFKADIIKNEEFSDIKLEDYDFWLRILQKTNIAASASSVPLACYSKVSGSRSSDKFSLLGGYWDIFLKYSNMSKSLTFYRMILYLFNFAFKYKYIRSPF